MKQLIKWPNNTSSEKNISTENITTEATPEPPKIVSQLSPTNNIEPTVESPKL